MSKTIEEIRNDVAIDFGYKNLDQLLAFNDSCIVDIINRVSERYARSQTQELQEQNAELVDLVERCKDVIYAYNDYRPTATGNEILQAIQDRLTKYNHLNKKP